MRILMFTEFFPVNEDAPITGGIEARCHYIVQLLRGRHEIEVAAKLSDGSVWEYASMSSVPKRLLFLSRLLVQGLRSDADLIEGTNHVVFPVAWAVALLRRRPVVFWYADVLLGSWSRDFGPAGLIGEVVERLILRLPVSRYIAISASTKRKLVANGVPAERVDVIPCGHDPALVAAVTAEAPAPVYTICVVGRLVGYKGVDLVLEAATTVARRHPGLRVLIIGRGPDLDRLRDLAVSLGIADRVDFRGFVPAHIDVLRLMASSRLVVSASTVEGFGIVLVEAMSLGIPYVATDIDAFREFQGRGEAGLLFGRGDADDLASKIERLLDDPDLYASCAAEGRRAALDYTWQQVASETEVLYQEVVRESQLAGRRLWRRLRRYP